jgi:hypothetical protein
MNGFLAWSRWIDPSMPDVYATISNKIYSQLPSQLARNTEFRFYVDTVKELFHVQIRRRNTTNNRCAEFVLRYFPERYEIDARLTEEQIAELCLVL